MSALGATVRKLGRYCTVCRRWGREPSEIAGACQECRDLAVRYLYRPPWNKHCGCGAVYGRGGWLALPLRGTQPGDPALEYRDCPCGSTLAVALTPEGDRVP